MCVQTCPDSAVNNKISQNRKYLWNCIIIAVQFIGIRCIVLLGRKFGCKFRYLSSLKFILDCTKIHFNFEHLPKWITFSPYFFWVVKYLNQTECNIPKYIAASLHWYRLYFIKFNHVDITNINIIFNQNKMYVCLQTLHMDWRSRCEEWVGKI